MLKRKGNGEGYYIYKYGPEWGKYGVLSSEAKLFYYIYIWLLSIKIQFCEKKQTVLCIKQLFLLQINLDIINAAVS
jgi:hypothetical protein